MPQVVYGMHVCKILKTRVHVPACVRACVHMHTPNEQCREAAIRTGVTALKAVPSHMRGDVGAKVHHREVK